MRVTTYILLFLLSFSAVAQNNEPAGNFSKNRADSLYIADDYAGAIAMYEKLLEESGESASLYYNLGNSYYKTDNIAKAILNYERALLLSPVDEDIEFNLNLARSKTVDKESEGYEIFFVAWLTELANLFSLATWSVVAIVSFILMLVALLFFLSTRNIGVKKCSFFIGLAMLFVAIVGNFAAWHHYYRLTKREHAIITQPTVTAKSTPSESGTSLFVIHEGRKVIISDDSMKEWKEIQLEEGSKGWIPSASLERI